MGSRAVILSARFAITMGLAAMVAACGGQAPTTTAPSLGPTELAPTASTAVIASAEPASTPPPTPSPTPTATPAGPFTLTSSAFAAGASIPARYTCDGAGVSPALAWTGTPGGTASLALLVDDPDANGFVHWVVFDVDPSVAALPEGVPLLAGGGPPQGRNSFGKVGYGGPCPPSGTHHYRFRLFAVSTVIGLDGTPSASDVLAAVKGQVLGEADLTGTYKRG